MSRRSRFRPRSTNPLGKTQAAFEDWLSDRDYRTAMHDTPMAVAAVTLVDAFLYDYPEFEKYEKVVRQHAEAIGFVSDYDIDMDTKLGYEEYD